MIYGTYYGQDNKGSYFKQEHFNEQNVGKSLIPLFINYKKTYLQLYNKVTETTKKKLLIRNNESLIPVCSSSKEHIDSITKCALFNML